MTEKSVDYESIKAVLDFENKSDSVDLKFYDNGNTAIFGYFDVTIEILGIIDRTQESSTVFITVDNQRDTFTVNTRKLADFLELDLRFTLNHDENPPNIKAWVAEIPNIL